MKKKIFEAIGMPILSLPVTKKNRINNERRNIQNMEITSAAHMISVTGIRPIEPLIFCGKQNKAYLVIRQLIKMSDRPFVLLGTKRDLVENSCFHLLKFDWKRETPQHDLPEGNGIIVLKTDGETDLLLKEYVSDWDSHLIIMCLGNGIQMDQDLLNLLNCVGHYILLSEALPRSIKSSDGSKLSVEELLQAMEYILVSSIGNAGKELMKVLPDYEYERITNTTDLSIHRDSPHEYRGGQHHRNGGGIRLSQSKTLDFRCILSQDDLTKMQDTNTLFIYNARSAHTWVAQISG